MQRCTEQLSAEPHYTDSVRYSDRQDTEINQGEPSLPTSTTGKCGMPCFCTKHRQAFTLCTTQKSVLASYDVTTSSDTSLNHSRILSSCVCAFVHH